MRSNRQLYRIRRKIPLFVLVAMGLFVIALCLITSVSTPTAFAAQPPPSSPSENSQDLLRAGVSVVRLLIKYEKADNSGPVYCTGLGAIVASWSAPDAPDQKSWVLTDSSLVNDNQALCANGHPQATLSSIEVYLSAAYNQQAMNFQSSVGSVVCQDKDCHNGPALFTFALQGPLLPFIDLAQQQSNPHQDMAIQLTTTNAGLGSASSTSVLPSSLPTPSIASATSSDASTFQTQVEKWLTPSQVSPTNALEAGTPLINTNGQLTSLNLSSPSAKQTTPSLQSFIENTVPNSQSHSANIAHDGWQQGMDAYANKDFSKAHTQFQMAADANSHFQAAKDFALASLNLENSFTPNQSIPSNMIAIGWVSIRLWQLVIVIVVMLVVVLFVIFLRVRDQQSLGFLEADRQVMIEAPQIAEMERAKKAQQIAEMEATQWANAQRSPYEQPIQQSPVLVPAQPMAPRLLCPRCGELVSQDANYCSKCRFFLSLSESDLHLRAQMISRPIVSNHSPIDLPTLPVLPVDSGQVQSIELKIPPDKNDVSVEPPSKKSVAEEQAQSNPVVRPSKPINRRLGNYRLIRLLGNGGFADVYLGEHVYLKKHAAIKVQYIRLAKEAIKGFLDEARTIAGLDHPHIIRVLDFGLKGEEPDLEQIMLNVEGSTPFLVMDYASGGSLRQRHPKGSRLSLDTVISYIVQVAEALQYAHQKRLIHRDIKPENMLIGSRDEILLSDFGIAVVAHSEHSITTQKMAGTLPYMAPEQIRGKPQPASDQYSLGIVVYEWLSGSRPFQGPSEWEIINQHLSSPPPSLREKDPTISKEVKQVVLRTLSKDPRQRFASISDFAKALAAAH